MRTMRRNTNIEITVKNSLCTGCGVCQDVCPQKAIEFGRKAGMNTPHVDSERCQNKEGCSICYKVCPGQGIDLNKYGKNLYEGQDSFHDENIGYYRSCYSGFSLDENIRFHSASGGMLSQFLVYLLENKHIKGAVVTKYDSKELMTPQSFIALSRQDILSAKSSKYCPVSLNGIAAQIKAMNGRVVVVGLPCHIHGFRKMTDFDKKLKSLIFGYFSIYCSSTKNHFAQDYLSRKYHIDRKKLKYFSYRDEGCLGFLKAVHTDGRSIKIDFREYYHPLRSFFKPRRCLSCIDHYGELADICFGDIQVDDYKNDTVGVNSVVVRDKHFEGLLKNAEKQGYLKLDPITPELLNKSQKTMLRHKKHVSVSAMFLDKILHNIIPQYDVVLKSRVTIRNLIWVLVAHCQRFVGRTKWLWFVIDLAGKKKNTS